MFTDSLKAAELNAIAFDSPLTALEYTGENHNTICLIVTDWRMPDIDGLELTKNVSEIDDEIKVILMSAYDLEKDQLKEINNNDYLRKPIHMNKLIDAVKKEVYGTITV